MRIAPDSTDVTTYFNLRVTGATITGIDLQYTRAGSAAAAKVDATALAAANSAHGDNKAFELDSTTSPGLYRVDWPDAAFAAGAGEVVLSVVYGVYVEQLRVVLEAAPNAVAPDNSGIGEIKAQTNKLNFTGTDIKATLDGEEVTPTTASKTGYALTATEDERRFVQALKAKYGIKGILYFVREGGDNGNSGLLPSEPKLDPGPLFYNASPGDGMAVCHFGGSIEITDAAAGAAGCWCRLKRGHTLFGMGASNSILYSSTKLMGAADDNMQTVTYQALPGTEGQHGIVEPASNSLIHRLTLRADAPRVVCLSSLGVGSLRNALVKDVEMLDASYGVRIEENVAYTGDITFDNVYIRAWTPIRLASGLWTVRIVNGTRLVHYPTLTNTGLPPAGIEAPFGGHVLVDDVEFDIRPSADYNAYGISLRAEGFGFADNATALVRNARMMVKATGTGTAYHIRKDAGDVAKVQGGNIQIALCDSGVEFIEPGKSLLADTAALDARLPASPASVSDLAAAVLGLAQEATLSGGISSIISGIGALADLDETEAQAAAAAALLAYNAATATNVADAQAAITDTIAGLENLSQAQAQAASSAALIAYGGATAGNVTDAQAAITAAITAMRGAGAHTIAELYALEIAIKLKTDTLGAGVTAYVGTVASGGTVNLIQGDPYTAALGNSITFDITGYSGPSIDGGAGKFEMARESQVKRSAGTAFAAEFSAVCNFAQSGSTVTVTVADVVATATAALEVDGQRTNYTYQVRSGDRTIGEGTTNLKRRIAAAS